MEKDGSLIEMNSMFSYRLTVVPESDPLNTSFPDSTKCDGPSKMQEKFAPPFMVIISWLWVRELREVYLQLDWERQKHALFEGLLHNTPPDNNSEATLNTLFLDSSWVTDLLGVNSLPMATEFKCMRHSRGLRLNFYKVAELTLNDSGWVLFKEALVSLATDFVLPPLIPYFSYLIADEISYDLNNFPILFALMLVVNSLLQNPHIHSEPYLHQLMPSTLTCLVAKRLGSRQTNNHWVTNTSYTQAVQQGDQLYFLYLDTVANVFVNLDKQDDVPWKIMIAGYGNKRNGEKAAENRQRMHCCGFEPVDVTYINMLAAGVKSGYVQTRLQLFDCRPYLSFTSWIAILSGHSQRADHREAVELFRKRQFQYQQLIQTTMVINLSLCAELGLLGAGKQVHAFSQKLGFSADVYVAISLINIYSQCGKMKLSDYAFITLPELNVVCGNLMIVGSSINSLEQVDLAFFKRIRQLGFFPFQLSFATIVSSCARLPSLFQGQHFQAQLVKDGPHTVLGIIGVAASQLELPLCQTVIAWLVASCRSKLIDEVLSVLNEMKNYLLSQPAIFIPSILFQSCAAAIYFKLMELLYDEMDQRFFTTHIITDTVVLVGYGNARLFDHRQKVLPSMLQHTNCKPDVGNELPQFQRVSRLKSSAFPTNSEAQQLFIVPQLTFYLVLVSATAQDS